MANGNTKPIREIILRLKPPAERGLTHKPPATSLHNTQPSSLSGSATAENDSSNCASAPPPIDASDISSPARLAPFPHPTSSYAGCNPLPPPPRSHRRNRRPCPDTDDAPDTLASLAAARRPRP